MSLDADPTWGGLQRLVLRVSGAAAGALQLEVMRGGFVSASKTLLVSSDAALAGEVRAMEIEQSATDIDTLMQQLGSLVALAAAAEVAEAGDEERSACGRAARRLLPFVLQRKWAAATQLVLACLAADLEDPREAMAQADVMGAGTTGMPILQLAVRSQSEPLVRALLAWGAQRGYAFNATMPGRRGLTALHLAALVADGGAIAGLLTEECPDALAGWESARCEDGQTPLMFAEKRGNLAIVERLIAATLYRRVRGAACLSGLGGRAAGRGGCWQGQPRWGAASGGPPPCLPACLPPCLPACLPSFLLPACQPAWLEPALAALLASSRALTRPSRHLPCPAHPVLLPQMAPALPVARVAVAKAAAPAPPSVLPPSPVKGAAAGAASSSAACAATACAAAAAADDGTGAGSSGAKGMTTPASMKEGLQLAAEEEYDLLEDEEDEVAAEKAAARRAARPLPAQSLLLTFRDSELEAEFSRWFNSGQVPVDIAFMVIAVLSQGAWIFRWSSDRNILALCMLMLMLVNGIMMQASRRDWGYRGWLWTPVPGCLIACEPTAKLVWQPLPPHSSSCTPASPLPPAGGRALPLLLLPPPAGALPRLPCRPQGGPAGDDRPAAHGDRFLPHLQPHRGHTGVLWLRPGPDAVLWGEAALQGPPGGHRFPPRLRPLCQRQHLHRRLPRRASVHLRGVDGRLAAGCLRCGALRPCVPG